VNPPYNDYYLTLNIIEHWFLFAKQKLIANSSRMKETIPDGETRKENRQAFIERGNCKGFRSLERNAIAYGYRAVSWGFIKATERLVQEELIP
jgi:hypothetical protein